MASPLFQTAQFVHGGKHEYTRVSNPTVELFEQRVAALEHMEFAIAFASGVASIHGVIRSLTSEETVYVLGFGYAGTLRVLKSEDDYASRQWKVIKGPAASIPQQIQGPGLLWIESPSNPYLEEHSIAEIRAVLREDVRIVVDNTAATPICQRPGEHGASIVVHSATKFLGGHSDAVAGVVVTSDPGTAKFLRSFRTSHGACLDPFSAWLCLRGMQTLALRVERGAATAARIARSLASHPAVQTIYYPGFGERERRPTQMSSGGAVLSLRLHPAATPGVFARSLRLVTLASSFGAVETLINQCAVMSHQSLSDEERARFDLDLRVFRLSCGIEDEEDILADLNQALNRSLKGDHLC